MSTIISISIIYLLALISPGPDFAIITRNSLIYSRKIGVLTSLGIAIGTCIHVFYSLLGIGFIISQSIFLFNTIKLIGAGYLIFVGVQALLAKKSTATSAKTDLTEKNEEGISNRKAIQMGFLCSVLNPKTTLFFLVLFTQMITPQTPMMVQIICGAYMAGVTFVWFGFVATVMSQSVLKRALTKIQSGIEKTIGAVLVLLGLKLALSSSK